jgi:uncharacterized protein involved in exopolysaccharide biosynthesis
MESTTQQDTFSLLDTFDHLINNWWKITLFTILFGLLGLGFSFIQPPKYEAEAIFSATLDYRDINFENLVDEGRSPLVFTQYEVDLALSVVQRSLIKVRNEALAYAQTLDPTLTPDQFLQDSLIERLHSRWQLSFRHEDPQIAQQVVNYWAELGRNQLEQDQASERVEPYVMVDFLSEASLPGSPVYQNRNILMLAGAVIGFVAGIAVIDFQHRYLIKRKKA